MSIYQSSGIPQRHNRVRGLDGLRALCVVLVFLDHFVFWRHGLGGLGVKLFFTLSGFLIVGILHKQRAKVERGASSISAEFTQFWRSRVLRIFPIYFLALFGVLLYALYTGRPANHEGLLFYFSFLGNVYIQYFSHAWGSFGHLWSISVEQHFYMLVSPLLLVTQARSHRPTLVLVLLVCVATVSQDLWSWETTPKPYHVADMLSFVFMAVGGLIALATTGLARLLSSPRWTFFLFATGVVVFAASNFGPINSGPGNVQTALTLVGSLAICIAAIGFIPQRQESRLVTLLEAAPLRHLGTVSYGFYVYHYFVPPFVHFKPLMPQFPLMGTALVVAQFLCTWGLATLSWRLIEQPLLRLKGGKPLRQPRLA